MSRRRAAGEGTVARRKDGRWAGAITVGYDADNKQQRRWAYGRTRQEAAEKLRALRQAQASNALPDASGLTLEAYLRLYLAESRERVRPATLESMESQLRLHVIPRLGRVPLARLQPVQVQAVISALSRARGPSLAARVRSTLGTALTRAVRLNALARNPVSAVEAPRARRAELDVWSPDEVRAFLDAPDRLDRYYLTGRLALTTGLRRGELLGLRWEDVSGSSLRVRRTLGLSGRKRTMGPPKSRAGERLVPLPPDALELLDAQRADQAMRALGAWEDHGLVFPSERGTPVHPSNFAQRWRAYLRSRGLREITFHSTRHTYASLAIAAGMDPVLLSRLLGHARASMTLDVYAHAWESRRAGAASSLDDLLRGR